MELPKAIRIMRCATQVVEHASIETLSREEAKRQVDAVWWNDLRDTLRDPNHEPDRHWEWRAIVSVHQNKPYFRAVCAKSADAAVQAVLLFRVDALSALEKGQRAVFIDRLAAAPRNRDYLVKEPLFRGGGSGLLAYAVAVSYSLGFAGRVNLFPVANEEFYARQGFKATSESQGEDTLFELPASSALAILKTRGLIDG